MDRPASPWFQIDGFYQSALVYALPPLLSDQINRWRGLFGSQARSQLTPHMTLCFLGDLGGLQAFRLWEALGREIWPSITVEILGVGAFGKSGSVSNTHLVLRAEQSLIELHERALKIGQAFPEFEPGPHTGEGWTPHISIVDGGTRLAVLDLPGLGAWTNADISLSRPHIISKRLDPIEILALDSR